MSLAMNLRDISYLLATFLPLCACGDDKSDSTGGASTGAATESGSETSDAGTTTQTNPTTGATGTGRGGGGAGGKPVICIVGSKPGAGFGAPCGRIGWLIMIRSVMPSPALL